MTAPICPLCKGVGALFAQHPEAHIYRCASCQHCFSDPASLTALETYDADYYERKHRRWFENPDIGLFEAIIKTTNSLQPTARRILDIGCGRGDFLRHWASRVPGLEFIGIDFSDNPPQPGIQIRKGDFFTEEFSGRFDVVTNFMVIEHVADPIAFICRLSAITNANGLIFINTINEQSVLYRLADLARRLGLHGPFNRLYSRHHLNHFNTASLRSLVESNGLTIVHHHRTNMPLAAVDFGDVGMLTGFIYRLGVSFAFALGTLTGATYAQTLVCRPSQIDAGDVRV